MTIEITCSNCRRRYSEQQVAPLCPVCGGIYHLSGLFFDPAQVDESQAGVWRYRPMLGLPENAPMISLGEGNTPLVWREVFGHRLAFKLENLNPTGSYQDRGSAVLLSFLRSQGVQAALEDSSGNASVSFAAYAAQCGIQAQVFLPDSIAAPKRKQIEAYGAQIQWILGRPSQVQEAALRAAKEWVVYASYAATPFVLPAYATIAYELVQQLGRAPGAVIAPVGHGNLLLGLGMGFQALLSVGMIEQAPRLVGVQALACAPLWAVYQYGMQGMGWVTEGETLAVEVRVRFPRRGDALLQMLAQSGGELAVIEEDEIMAARDSFEQLGLFIEPSSAIVWRALQDAVGRLPEPIAVVLTGAGFKTPPR
jgi:threonine synthase